MSGAAWSIEIRSPEDQAAFATLRSVLTRELGLDWRATAGSPDGHEIAEDCAESLWSAGFRLKPTTTPPTTRTDEESQR